VRELKGERGEKEKEKEKKRGGEGGGEGREPPLRRAAGQSQ
jgi:hypothetical protein